MPLVIKLFGVGLILSTGLAGAFLSSRFERRRLAVTDGWIALIGTIRGQVDCYLRPIGEILAGCDSELIRAGGTTDLQSVFRASSRYLTEPSRRAVSLFVGEIGESYRAEQLKSCERCLLILQSEREKLAAQLPATVRTRGALCLCSALAVAVLLW